MSCCGTNKGNALPSACDSGVLIPRWGDPERFEYENFADPLVGVQKFSEWQLADSDTMLRFEYNHLDMFDDGFGPGAMVVSLYLADDDEGANEELVATDRLAVPYNESEKWYSVSVDGVIPAGTYFRVAIFVPVLTVTPDELLNGDASPYQWSFATLSAMENQT